jgi:exopolyphosphatase / guanosine-5'-triphosphate,3'-diphosphate pyrophosphatase
VTRVGVVDIGSNSTRLLIADVEDGRVTAELERRSEVTRLGQGVDETGRLADEAMDRVRATLAQYRTALDELDADRAVAVLTSATRDADNGPAFVQEVRDDYGLDAKVLPGDEEARLSFLGATSERDADDTTPTVMIDIGGGSTEFVVGQGHEMSFHVSTQAGVVRHSERHLHHDPPARAELEALAGDVREIYAAAIPADIRARRGIAVAGTATQLASVDGAQNPHGHVLTTTRIAELRDMLAALPLEERKEVAGLDPARAPTIVAGAVLLGEALRRFALDAVEVSEHDILRGVALDTGN